MDEQRAEQSDSASLTLEKLTAILTDPATLRGDHLPEEERREHERCTQSIVDAAIWSHPRYGS
jgi:hypothetical protein